jgi:hypothetical protein
MSKTYIEQTLPTPGEMDKWTENATLWTGASGLIAIDNYNDYINGTRTYYGNKSIEFKIYNSRQIWMELNNIGPINCSSPNGYQTLYLRIKWISPDDKPENVTIYLLSTTSSDYFYHNLTEKFSDSTSNVWNNLTIPLESETWLNNSAGANWSYITGLKLGLSWPESSDINLLVDGLFFGGIFESPVENAGYMLSFLVFSFTQFMVKWILLGGILYIMTKAFKAKTVWRPMLILVGFALITMFIQAVINLAVFSTLPKLYYPLELMGGVKGEGENAYNQILEATWLASEINWYLQLGVYVWTIALCTIATRLLTEFAWMKSILVATIAYFASLLVGSFLLGY